MFAVLSKLGGLFLIVLDTLLLVVHFEVRLVCFNFWHLKFAPFTKSIWIILLSLTHGVGEFALISFCGLSFH